MTLLTLCQNVADDVGVERPTTIVGNPDRTAKRLLRAATRECQLLAKQDWSILQRPHEYSTVAGVDAYDLPDDFESLLSDTSWDRTNYWLIRGGMTAKEWQVRKSAIIATTAFRKEFRIKRGAGNVRQYFIDPVPTEADDLVFEYKSKGWAQSSTGVVQSQWLADTDTAILDEDLVEMGVLWRYLKRIGQSYIEEFNEHALIGRQMLAQDRAPRTLVPRTNAFVIGAANVPTGNFPGG
ncbi:MAG: hypothetical protein ABUJ98_14175 [Hyphomicrobium sp.]